MSLTIAVDLRHMLGAARDQGDRPTCLSFAVSDSHAALRPGWAPLSCEFIHYQSQQISGSPRDAGAVIDDMLVALSNVGQPLEQDWPYLNVVGIPMDHWVPPAGIGSLFKRNGAALIPNATSAIIKNLNKDLPAILHLYLSDSFYWPVDGRVQAPNSEQPDPTRRHAVIAVGHGILDGEVAILVRNSWGPDWGDSGHAWLSEPFLSPRIRRLTLIQ